MSVTSNLITQMCSTIATCPNFLPAVHVYSDQSLCGKKIGVKKKYFSKRAYQKNCTVFLTLSILRITQKHAEGTHFDFQKLRLISGVHYLRLQRRARNWTTENFKRQNEIRRFVCILICN